MSMFANIFFLRTVCYTTDTDSSKNEVVTAVALLKPTNNGNWVSFVFFVHETLFIVADI